jgi:L-ribulose-5-phosphate 4-epimerase
MQPKGFLNMILRNGRRSIAPPGREDYSMTHDEKGYIQFQCEWEPADPPAVPASLLAWRERLHSLGLIGVYPDGVGFGNVSIRGEGHRFLISGTATGQLPSLTAEHFAEVTAFDFATNALRCRGQVKASSESLSHAAAYVSDPTAQAVIHVHHLGLWTALRDCIPTTDHAAEAGTPEMAWAIEKLLHDEEVRRQGLFVMGGHREGLMAFGATIDEAGERLVRLLAPTSNSTP